MFKLSDMSHKVEKSKKSTAEAEKAEIPGSGPRQALGKCFSTFISSASVFISTAFPRFFVASFCRFYCRFWLPLLIAVLQGKIPQRYPVAELKRIEELRNSGIYGLR
jgi:hypothetical protein